MGSELKPCPIPWTGSGQRHGNEPGRWIADPIVRRREVVSGARRYRVECGCGVAGPMCDTEAEAIAAWNSRPETALESRVRVLTEALRALEKDCTSGMESGDWGNFTIDQWKELRDARAALAGTAVAQDGGWTHFRPINAPAPPSGGER